MYDGRTPLDKGTVVGHEIMGIIEETGDAVSSIKKGDRVVLPFNIACGFCYNCHRGNTHACLTMNPERPSAAYGYAGMGPYAGGQAEFVLIPNADFNCLKLPGTPFEASGVGAAIGLLELMGHRKNGALQALGLGAAIFETLEGFSIESHNDKALDPLKRHPSGWITRAGGALAGPIPTALRIASLFSAKRSQSLRRWASWSSILGSLATRIGWIYAGHISARDWKLPWQEEAEQHLR